MNRIKVTTKNYKESLKKAAAILKRGGLVIYPTETCYGIAGLADNQKAIDKLLRYKTLRKDKPISIAVTGKAQAAKYVQINRVAENIYNNFLPGPITVVSKGKGKLAEGVESTWGTQGIRISSHPLVMDLLKLTKKPFTATSANASYKKVPYTVEDVLNNLSTKSKKELDLILDVGRLPKRKPSTVVDTTLDNIYILREGAIKLKKAKVFKAESLDHTKEFVNKLFKQFEKYWGKREVVFLLQGDLGAGKTHFAKFLGEKLKVKEVVVSPTFNLCNEYEGKVGRKKIMFYHMDTYRMYKPEELEDLRPKQAFEAPNVVVVEWANKIHDYVQRYLKGAIVVEILITSPSENERVFEYQITKR